MIKKIAVVVYKIEKGKVLFFVAKRPEKYDLIWQYVTGHVEKDETFKEAVIRELHEELGAVRILNYFDLKSENIFSSSSGNEHQEKIFAIQIDEVDLLQKEEFSEYKWLSENEAIKLVHWTSHKASIKKAAELINAHRYPKIFIVCAPGGAGKDTIIERILSKFDLARPKTYTTRSLREDGKEWRIHVSENEFKKLEKRGDFIESNFFGGYWYATPREFIEQAIIQEKNIIIEIDLNGLQSFKKIYSNIVSFFIFTDLVYLEKRLRERGCHDEKYIKTRMEIAKCEIADMNICDFIIRNEEGKLEEAVKSLENKIRMEIK